LERRVGALIWTGIVGAFAAILALDVIGGEPGAPLNHALDLGVAFFGSCLILGLACDCSRSRPNLVTRVLASPVMVYLGVISYALFLIQLTEPCQWLYWILLGEMLGIENRIVRAILLYAMTTALAAILYKLIERPAKRWLHVRLVKI
jgi:peptidoglycan/LPS O-acetylase OafA/YrhL